MLVQLILFSLTVLSALASDRAWNHGYPLSAFVGFIVFLMNFSFFAYSIIYGAEGVRKIISLTAIEF